MSEKQSSVCNLLKIDFGPLIKAQNGNSHFDLTIREIECIGKFKIVHKPNIKEGSMSNYD